jgi:hypothetical protein
MRGQLGGGEENVGSERRMATGDRPEYERALDEALRTEEIQEALRDVPAGLNREQLRTRALGAADAIAAAAAPEYIAYAGLRAPVQEVVAAEEGEDGDSSVGAAVKRAGLLPALAVLVPVLSGVAAVLFLMLGYALRATGTGPAIGTPLITVGYGAAGVFAVALLVNLAGLLLTARTSTSASHDAQRLAEARDVWRQALMDRGILPYLRDQLADHTRTASSRDTASPEASGDRVSLIRRRPRLGYSSPDFASPDFTSPDYEGPSGSEA